MQISKSRGFPSSRFLPSSARAGQSPMPKFTTGFTLIEIMVTIVIATTLMTVVMFSYSSSSDSLALSAAAQELAVTLRQAQAYAIGAKETTLCDGGDFSCSYGLFVSIPASTPASGYRTFIDYNSNHYYDVGPIGCGNNPTECLERTDLRDGIKITAVCDTNDANPCSPLTLPSFLPAVKLNIYFQRPNPNAQIYFLDSGGTQYPIPPLPPYSIGKIQLTSPKGVNKYVIINSSGQITVQ